MYAIYVDESGNPDIKDYTSKHYIVAGVSTPLKSWKAKDKAIRDSLTKNRLDGIELHTAWMARIFPEQQRIPNFIALNDEDRRKSVLIERKKDIAKASIISDRAIRSLRNNYKKTKDYIHLTHAERVNILQEIADIVASWGDVKLFAEAQQKASLDPDKPDKYRSIALEQVTTRFNTYLENACPFEAMGILVHDQNQANSLQLTGQFREWHKLGTKFARLSRIAETPLFVDSSLTTMVQVADLISYAVRRFFDVNETNLFDRIYSKFDRKPNGVLVGLRHYTGKVNCKCRVCVDHNR
ncbi:MAG: DUF3800 domain-containing protein [Thermodesulfovibrionales bacterium]|nr:DUF3800 domain-containing protein [Thermodesulfovibrionales bacterium]